MASLTIENYVKTIYSLSENSVSAISPGAIAEALTVAPGTVTSMMKTLSESGLVDYKPYEGVRLTDSGNVLALRVIRRHRLIESFLVATLNLDSNQVHDEAENLEHAVSDFLVDRIDAYLEFPTHDPHGSPIPSADGQMGTLAAVPLGDLESGTRFRLKEIADQSNEFSDYVRSIGLEIGKLATVEVRDNIAKTITISAGNNQATLSIDVASNLLVVAAD